MTPRKKAIELVDKFIFIDNGERFQIISMADEKRAIQCALIAVEEVINEFYTHPIAKIYWQEVKQEIEKL
jgi:hypothetical protein